MNRHETQNRLVPHRDVIDRTPGLFAHPEGDAVEQLVQVSPTVGKRKSCYWLTPPPSHPSARAPDGIRHLQLYLIKPSRYDDEGYVIRHWKRNLMRLHVGQLAEHPMICDMVRATHA